MSTSATDHTNVSNSGHTNVSNSGVSSTGVSSTGSPVSRFGYATHLSCRECGHTCALGLTHVCEWCFGPLEVAYDYERIAATISREGIARGPSSIWRYAELLPSDAAGAVSAVQIQPPAIGLNDRRGGLAAFCQLDGVR